MQTERWILCINIRIFALKFPLQILPDDARNNANGDAVLFINARDGEAHIVFFARRAVVIAGVRDSIDAICQPDIPIVGTVPPWPFPAGASEIGRWYYDQAPVDLPANT